ncbi:MAG: GntR family transcriptional regulator [Melioribacteraceae bacterium]
MEIDRNSALPLYYQLKEKLKEEIDIGKYNPGDKILSENELSALLGISRNTSKQAIADLVAEGVLYRIQGKGTFVAEKKIFKGMTESFSFSSESNSNLAGLETKVIIAEEIKESMESIEFLKLKESEKIYRIQRIRLHNDIPLVLQTSYIPKFFCPTLLDFDLTQSMYKIMKENFKVNFSYFTENLSCIMADKYIAEKLLIKKGAPLFLLTRKTFTKKDEIIEVARSFMPGDRCEFYFKHGEEMSIELNHITRQAS